MDDIIYVIYLDGKRYDKSGRKIAYLTEGSAKQVITSEAKDIARYEFEEDNKRKYKYWYDLTEDVKKFLIEETKKRFEIIEYRPCKRL